MKKLLNLKGAEALSAATLKAVRGGGRNCFSAFTGGPGCVCNFETYCVVVPPTAPGCPDGSVPQNPGCFL